MFRQTVRNIKSAFACNAHLAMRLYYTVFFGLTLLFVALPHTQEGAGLERPALREFFALALALASAPLWRRLFVAVRALAGPHDLHGAENGLYRPFLANLPSGKPGVKTTGLKCYGKEYAEY